MHLATSKLDAGPVVTYCVYSLRSPTFAQLWQEVEGRSLSDIQASEGENNWLFQEIRRQGVARELPLLLATVRAFAQGRIRIENKRVVDGAGNVIAGYDLTEEIESTVAAAQA